MTRRASAAAKSRFQSARLATGSPFELRKPLRSQPARHSVRPFSTYWLSETSSTVGAGGHQRQPFDRRGQLGDLVGAEADEAEVIGLGAPSGAISTAPQPAGPGLVGAQAPSV